MLPKIKNIQIKNDHLIHIILMDNFEFTFDCTVYLNYPCNKALKNSSFFKSAKFYGRMIYWDDNHDIHLDQMIPEEYYINQLNKVTK
jgi:hypothetical protein